MKVVVTGGAGFIGTSVVRELSRAPGVSEIVVVDDFSTGSPANLRNLPVCVIRGSILDGQVLDMALGGAASVVHLAAIGSVARSVDDPVASHQANATGTVMVLEAARRHAVSQVILASSSSVYGANTTLPKAESLRPMPLSPYAVSKLATEAYALAYAACYRLPVLAFRFFNVFGPGQSASRIYSAVVPAFVSAALEGRPLRLFGDGRQTRDFTYVGSVARVITDAVCRRVSAPDAVNLAFGLRVSLLELIAEMEDLFGRRLDVVHEPPRRGDVRDSQADNTRLRALFPDVAPTPLRLGLTATIGWMSDTSLPGQALPMSLSGIPEPTLT